MSARRPVLLVEDDLSIREGLREFLEFEGFVVETAENGRVGLEAVRRFGGGCVVLLDLQMPVMTGEEMLRALEAERDAAVRDVPILVLTARGEGFEHPRIAGTLRKPIDLESLLDRVRALTAA